MSPFFILTVIAVLTALLGLWSIASGLGMRWKRPQHESAVWRDITEIVAEELSGQASEQAMVGASDPAWEQSRVRGRIGRRLRDWERGRALRAGVVLLALSGLAALGVDGSRRQTQQVVHVTSLQGVSGVIQVPADGHLRFRDVLDRAAEGSGRQLQEDHDEPLLVGVRVSGEGDETDIWYCPASLVWQSAVGNWRLPAGCSVRLVRFQDTSLGRLLPRDEGAAFEVRGMIERPGHYQTQTMSEIVLNVHTEAYGGAMAMDGSGPDVMVIHRQADDAGPREHFCLPIAPEWADLTLLSGRIRSGDVIEYTRLEDLAEVIAKDIEIVRSPG